MKKLQTLTIGKGMLYRVQHTKLIHKGKFTFDHILAAFKINRKDLDDVH